MTLHRFCASIIPVSLAKDFDDGVVFCENCFPKEDAKEQHPTAVKPDVTTVTGLRNFLIQVLGPARTRTKGPSSFKEFGNRTNKGAVLTYVGAAEEAQQSARKNRSLGPQLYAPGVRFSMKINGAVQYFTVVGCLWKGKRKGGNPRDFRVLVVLDNIPTVILEAAPALASKGKFPFLSYCCQIYPSVLQMHATMLEGTNSIFANIGPRILMQLAEFYKHSSVGSASWLCHGKMPWISRPVSSANMHVDARGCRSSKRPKRPLAESARALAPAGKKRQIAQIATDATATDTQRQICTMLADFKTKLSAEIQTSVERIVGSALDSALGQLRSTLTTMSERISTLEQNQGSSLTRQPGSTVENILMSRLISQLRNRQF